MRKLVLLTTIFIAGTANAGLLDGFSNILGKTGNVLNTLTGTPKTVQGVQNYSASKSNFIRIPDKETSEYKFEDVTINLNSALGHPVAYVTGSFYNKTDNPVFSVRMTIPTYNKEGFDDMSINTNPMASPHGKTKIQESINLQYPDSKPDLSKIKYIPVKY